MSINDIWKKYIKVNIIGTGIFGDVYKAKNKENGYYYAIKEIDKIKFNQQINILTKEIELMNKIKTENIINIKEIIDTKEYIYIIMDLCECNLEDYIINREKPVSINEIRHFLIEINNVFKIMLNQNIIHNNLNPRHFLLSFERLDKCIIKLSPYGSIKPIDQSIIDSNINSKSISNNNSFLTMAPEVLKDEKELISSKSDIWSLGIIIYYILFKEYPYNGNREIQILKNIETNKNLKLTENEILNDLLNKMLKVDPNERISWNDYFNHSFFKQETLFNFPQFDFKCKIHNQNMNFYCKNCKKNICEDCINEHSNHIVIPFSKIGLNDEEKKNFDNITQQVEHNLNNLFTQLINVNNLFNKMSFIKENYSIYENDSNNNYKIFYIDILKRINEQLKNMKINLINLKLEKNNINNNYIKCEYDIKEDLNDSIQILNCLDLVKKNFPNMEGELNEKEIRENCEILLNESKINFSFKYQIIKKGKYTIKIICKQSLSNINKMFYDCSYITSLDLSNFNSKNITDMSGLFSRCTSLKYLNFFGINTDNVINMNRMFSNCSSLTHLDLSYFNTHKVTNMCGMFYYCSSLVYLDVSSFNTENVNNMKNMFCNCFSLTDLDLSNFNTSKVTNMSNMFYNCSSLKILDLSNFITDNVNNMSWMFYKCSALTYLDLSNFNTKNVNNMSGMFNDCSSLENLDLSIFNTENVTDMSRMFSKCSSLKILDLFNFNTEKVVNMSNMFCNCISLKSLDLFNFNTSNVTNINEIFFNLNKNCNILSNDNYILFLKTNNKD